MNKPCSARTEQGLSHFIQEEVINRLCPKTSDKIYNTRLLIEERFLLSDEFQHIIKSRQYIER